MHVGPSGHWKHGLPMQLEQSIAMRGEEGIGDVEFDQVHTQRGTHETILHRREFGTINRWCHVRVYGGDIPHQIVRGDTNKMALICNDGYEGLPFMKLKRLNRHG